MKKHGPSSEPRATRGANIAWDIAGSPKGSSSLVREALSSGERDRAFRQVIFSIPPGSVSTYGKVAAAAGYPLYHRAVARLLRTDPPDDLPWHRVVGAGGEIKLPGSAAKEQRNRLRVEGVQFQGQRIHMAQCECKLKPGIRGT